MPSKLELTTHYIRTMYSEEPLLRGAGYKQRALHGGKHGYVVKTENLSVRQNEDIHELLTGGSGASTF